MQEKFRMQRLDSKSRDCSWNHVGKLKKKLAITTTNPQKPFVGGFKNKFHAGFVFLIETLYGAYQTLEESM